MLSGHNAFPDRARRRLSRTTSPPSNEAPQCLWAYAWPGNIRELQHIREGTVLPSDGVILPDHLPPAIQKPGAQEGAMTSGRSLDETIEDIERQMILVALSRPGGLQVHTGLLSIAEQRLWYRIKKYAIQARVAATLPPSSPPPAAPGSLLPAPLCPSN